MELCHVAHTVDFRAKCSSMTNNFMINAVLIERAMSCWHLHQLISQTTQYLDSWLSDLLQNELKWNCWKSRGARAPLPHSRRHHCTSAAETAAVILVILLAADTYSGPFSEVPPVATSALAGCDDVGRTSGLLAAGSCRTVHGELSADELHVLKSISVSKTHRQVLLRGCYRFISHSHTGKVSPMMMCRTKMFTSYLS